ncbi:MAG TPA: glycosyltransferase family A protein, partial [Polyangiaceae bacterium]|nr:glycosyltransferase family A protein [Polyangiaceae bacterium]
EIIVVNDGSTDQSLAVISRYVNRVLVIDQPNQGHIAAYNRGFASSRGEIVVFLDADDLLAPEALSEAARAWSPECAKVQFDLSLIAGDGTDLGRRFCYFDATYDSARVRGSFLRTGTYRWPVTVGNAYARWFVDAAFPLALDHVGPDGALNTLAPVYGEVITIPKPLGCYRLHGANKWTTSPSTDLRLPVRIRNRRREVADMRWHAAQRGVPVPAGDVLDHELAFVNYRLSALVLGLDYEGRATDSRFRLFRAAGEVLRSERLPLKVAVAHALWFTALLVTPRPLARGLIHLRSNRTAVKSSVARWRRLMSNAIDALASLTRKRAA